MDPEPDASRRTDLLLAIDVYRPGFEHPCLLAGVAGGVAPVLHADESGPFETHACRASVRMRVAKDETGTLGECPLLRERNLDPVRAHEDTLVPEPHVPFRSRLFALVVVDQSLGPEVTRAALQVHVSTETRGAFLRQVGIVGLDVHRFRIPGERVRERRRRLRQRKRAALRPFLGAGGHGAACEAEPEQERARRAGEPAVQCGSVVHRRVLLVVPVSCRPRPRAGRTGSEAPDPQPGGSGIDGDSLDSRAHCFARRRGELRIEPDPARARWGRRVEEDRTEERALQRGPSTSSASASMWEPRSFSAGM